MTESTSNFGQLWSCTPLFCNIKFTDNQKWVHHLYITWKYNVSRVPQGLFFSIAENRLSWKGEYEQRWIKTRVRVRVINATFNNIWVISWQSVLLEEETRVPGENHWPLVSHWQTLSHNIVSSIKTSITVSTAH